MNRGLKQLLYGLFYLAIFLALGYGAYHAIVPAPSCFDNVQNQSEQGVDCGGPCAKVCAPAAGIQIIENALTFRLDDGHVGLLAYVQNPSQDYSSNYFDYSFSLYDVGGNIVDNVPSASFIYSGEAKYLFIPVVNVTSSLVDHSAVTIGNVNWAASSTMGAKPILGLEGLNTVVLPDNSGNLAVSGLLVNKDVTAFPRVFILAVFKDAAGHNAGISQTVIDNLGLNESRRFSVLHPPLSGADLGATQVFYYALRP